MTSQSFSLMPLSAQGVADITIKGQVARQSNTFYIRYVLAGDLGAVALQSLNINPARKDELWRTTCFEFLLAIKNKTQYWEFNISPSGNWNVYLMDAYRQVGMREEVRIKRLPFEVQKEANSISLELAITLNPIIASEKPIEVGVASVIETLNGQETYWALVHPHPEADFHVREGFVLEF